MPDENAEILALLDRHANAMAAGDAAAMAQDFAPDPVIYDLAPPLQNTLDIGGQQAWIDRWDEPPTLEYRDIRTTVAGDLAVAWGFVRTRTLKDGAEDRFWTRNSWAFRRQGGAWKIIHAHASVPFYMDGSERAAIDLEPEAGPARTS